VAQQRQPSSASPGSATAAPTAARATSAPRSCVVADGGSSRFGIALGLHRDESRPMSVAVRAYYRSPRRDGHDGGLPRDATSGRQPGASRRELLPGYGWIFPLDDGLVNVGWGLLNTSAHFRRRTTARCSTTGSPASRPSGRSPPTPDGGQAAQRAAADGPQPQPHVHKGALLVGDAAGMVNPFNGEGISYAIEAAEIAAEAADAALRTRSDAPLAAYPRPCGRAWGGYYTLGNVFVRLMGHPRSCACAPSYGMPRRGSCSSCSAPWRTWSTGRSADATDRLLNALSRAVPAA
jgi:menaquinone-9 beta-reductase